jgi:hypothetical protein
MEPAIAASLWTLLVLVVSRPGLIAGLPGKSGFRLRVLARRIFPSALAGAGYRLRHADDY